MRSLVMLALTAFITACVSPTSDRDRAWVEEAIRSRTGQGLGPGDTEIHIPLGVDLADGLDDWEAVALALANNLAFQAALIDLDVSRAELEKAGLLKNPVLSLLFPLGPKQLESTLHIAVDGLWERPRRIRVAALDTERVAETLVQEGLNLALRVRLAFVAAVAARNRVVQDKEAVTLMARQLDLDRARLEAGEIAPHVVALRLLELERARQNVASREALTSEATLQLQAAIGQDFGLGATRLTASSLPAEPPSLPELRRRAMAARPDLRAAEIVVSGAAAQVELTASEMATVQLIIDSNAQGIDGFEAGPGLEIEIPIFDTGKERRVAVRARLAAAMARLRAERRRVEQEVERGHERVVMARRTLTQHQDSVIPAAREALRAARAVYAAGDASQIVVVDAEMALQTEQGRAADLVAELHRAWVELEGVCGCRLDLSKEDAP